MSKSIDIDRAAQCVKNLVDINRCGTCDKLENLRRRSACYHIICDNCANREEDCAACSSSPKTSHVLISDESLTQKVNNALVLLNTFEDTFKTNVYRRQRISDQLKIEKEIFPECIQAPVKYCNKRKSSSSNANKENRRTSLYFGEEVPSTAVEMEKSKYIQNWLSGIDKNKSISPRKPFSDINIINQNFSRINNRNNVSLTKIKKVKNTESLLKVPKKKTNKIERSVSKNKTSYFINKHLKTVDQENICQQADLLKRNKKDNLLIDNVQCKVQDESGIVIDDDYIVLDDSQTPSVDKDALALQAVLEANKNQSLDYSSVLENKDNISEKGVNFIKVPYFLKSPLYKTCRECSNSFKKTNTTQSSKNVSITIVYNMTGHKESAQQSVSVQTELSEIVKSEIPCNFIPSVDIFENNAQDHVSEKDNCLDSQGIFSDMIKDHETHKMPLNQNISKKTLIIDESDSELEHESLNVTAEVEVHRSCGDEDYGVLCDVSLADLNERKRPSARGTTPDSTNSSDKENYDPNKRKRFKCDKKHSKKDKLNY